MDIGTGDVVGGVRIDTAIGKGGMGVVYRGTELSLNRTVAIKLVRDDLTSDPEFLARFARESEIAASLDHPHVVPVFSAGTDANRLYVAMRYVDGTDLRDAIKSRGRFDPATAATVAAQIASALDAAHRRGLVHRDVKPANILLAQTDGRPHAYLTDFGVCKRLDNPGMTQAGMMIGTDDYMAPEQFEGIDIDGRADVYSLGCVLQEMLTGQVPFPRDSLSARIHAHLHQPPPPLPPDVPPQLAAVVTRALAKRREDRYATAGEMARDLAAYGAGGGSATAVNTLVGQPSGPLPVHGGGAGTPYPQTPAGFPQQPVYTSAPVSYPPGPPSHPTGPAPGGGSSNRGRMLAIAAVVVVLVVAVAGVGGWLATRGGDEPQPQPEPQPPAAFGVLDGDPIAVGAEPSDIQHGEGFVWIANSGDGTISKIDPDTGDVENIDVGGTPTHLSVADGTVWVNNFTDGITPVDADSGEVGEVVGLETGVGWIAAGNGQVWVSNYTTGMLTRIDASTRRVRGTPTPLGPKPGEMAVGDTQLYSLTNDGTALALVDAAGGVVGSIDFDVPAGGVEIVDGTVWVYSRDTATPIDERSGAMGEPVPVSGAGILTAGDNGVFAAFPVDDEVRWLDLEGEQSKGPALDGIAKGTNEMHFVDGTLWLVDGPAGEAMRVSVN